MEKSWIFVLALELALCLMTGQALATNEAYVDQVAAITNNVDIEQVGDNGNYIWVRQGAIDAPVDSNTLSTDQIW